MNLNLINMKNKNYFLVLFLGLLFISCGLEPEPIKYGKDLCAHCNMKIMDKRYGAELVTSKGKIYKFDSPECLIDYIHQNSLSDSEISFTLVTGYNEPEKLINAYEAAFIISPKLPSPMGAFLTAFTNTKEAKKKIDEVGGELFDWNTIKTKIINR